MQPEYFIYIFIANAFHSLAYKFNFCHFKNTASIMIKFHSFPVVSILIISGMLTSTFLLTSCQDTFSEQNKLEKLYQDEYDTVEAKDVDSDFLELLRMRQFSSQQALSGLAA